MTIEEGVESVKVAGPGKPTGGKTSLEGESEDQINKPITVRNSVQEVSPGAPDTRLKKSSKKSENGSNNSNGFKKVDKSPDEASKHVPHYLRPSTSSCHHYCKYGVKPETPKHPHRHAKIQRKMSSSPTNSSPDAVKSVVPKTHKSPKTISGTHSPVGSSPTAVGDSSKVSPKGKTAVNKSESHVKARSAPLKSKSLPSALSPKSSPENKTKASVSIHTAVSKSSKPAINDHDNSKRATPSQNHVVNGHGIATKATPPSNAKKASSPSNAKKATSPSIVKKASPPSNGRKVTPSNSPNGHGNTKTVQISDKKAISKTQGNPARKVEKKAAVKSFSPRSITHVSSKPQEEVANKDGILEVCAHQEEKGIIDQVCAQQEEKGIIDQECAQQEEKGIIDQECANEGEDVHKPYEHSHGSDELSDEEHANGVVEHIGDLADGHSVEEYCNECNDGHVATIYAHYESTESDKSADEKNDDFEAYGEGSDGSVHYAESLADEYLDQDLDSEYSEEYSEYTESPGSEPHDEQEHQDRIGIVHHKAEHEEGSESLEKQKFKRGVILAGEEESQSLEKQRFRRGKILDAEEENRRAERRRFRRGRVIDYSNKKPEPENVELRHQEEQRRKAAEEFLLNHKIEEAVNKLSHTRTSKVKTLVGAFETVISLKESEVIEPKHVGAKDSPQLNALHETTKDSSLSSILHEVTADSSKLSSLQEYTEDLDQLSTLQVCSNGIENGSH